MYCCPRVTLNKGKNAAQREKFENACFAFIFARVVGKNSKTPKLSTMPDGAITQGGIGGLVSVRSGHLYTGSSGLNNAVASESHIVPSCKCS